MSAQDPLKGPDPERIEALSQTILLAIRDNYTQGPISRARVYEALNALAFCAALAIRGTDDPQALEFFSDSLNTYLKAHKLLEKGLDQGSSPGVF